MKQLLFLLITVLLARPSIAQDKEPSKNDPAKSSTEVLSNLTYLNAANFDFSSDVTGSYLGKLNIYAPPEKKRGWGFIAGIMRVKFNYNDSTNNWYHIENRLIHPLDSVKQGNKYLREYNKYSNTRSNTVWSFYMQPMWCLNTWYNDEKKEGLANGLYVHVHGELLVNKTNVTTSIQNIQRDTLLIDMGNEFNYANYLVNPLIINKTFLNGYFGVGFTLNVDPFKNGNSRFFFQPTLGWTTNYPNWTSQDIESTTVNPIPIIGGSRFPTYENLKIKGFYLIRAEFSQILSSNSQLIIGTDIRGLIPKYNPLYAAYLGLNVNLDALAKVVSDKKNGDDK